VKQYEIRWAELPAPAGRRSVLLLSRDDAYAYLNKFVVAEISTTIRDIPVEVSLGRREGLPRPCVANFDNLRTISRTALQERISRLAPKRIHEVKVAAGYVNRARALVFRPIRSRGLKNVHVQQTGFRRCVTYSACFLVASGRRRRATHCAELEFKPRHELQLPIAIRRGI